MPCGAYKQFQGLYRCLKAKHRLLLQLFSDFWRVPLGSFLLDLLEVGLIPHKLLQPLLHTQTTGLSSVNESQLHA